MSMKVEIWKCIPGYEKLYEVSNYGAVRRVEGYRSDGRKHAGHILKQTLSPSGYLVVSLSKEGESKQFRVHRLVALAFLPNPNNYQQVNHKDEDKTNNCLDNLEWCDAKYNTNYGTGHFRAAMSHTGKKHLSVTGGNNPDARKINQISLDGDFIRSFAAMMDAERLLNISHKDISLCCQGKRNTAGGFRWSYSD